MNKKKWIPLAALGVLAVGLGVGLAVLKSRPADTEADTGTPLSAIGIDSVTALRYTDASNNISVSLTKKATGESAVWTLDEDPKLPIDQSAADLVAADIAALKATRQLTDTSESAAMGFDSPTMTFALTAGDSSFELTVGAENTMTSAYYARVKGSDAVYMIAADSLSSLCKTAKELYAAQSVTTLTDTEVTAMTVDYGGAALRFQKNGDSWVLADDTGYALNQDTVSRMASTLCGLKTSWSVTAPAAPASYGLDQPNAKITLGTADGKTVTVAFGAADPADAASCYLTTTDAPGVVYEVAAENLSAFAVTKESLLAAADTAETAEAAAQYPVE